MFAAAIFLPLGYLAGVKLQSRFAPEAARRPSLSYVASTATIAFCCGIGTVAFMVGL